MKLRIIAFLLLRLAPRQRVAMQDLAAATRDANEDQLFRLFLPIGGIGLPFSLESGDFGTSPFLAAACAIWGVAR